MKIKVKKRSSKYKGLVYLKNLNKWIAMVGVSGISYKSQAFQTEEEAAKEYDNILVLHRPSTPTYRLNFPPEPEKVFDGGVAIYTSCGKKILLDLEDYEVLHKYVWCCHKKQKNSNIHYARRVFLYDDDNGKQHQKSVSMHREVLSFPDGMIDHINGNGLDNRKKNLRICANIDNSRNSSVCRSNNTSGYKGVCKCKNKTNPWRAYIVINYKQIGLGCFKTREEAAMAYNDAAVKYFGEFAKLNNIK